MSRKISIPAAALASVVLLALPALGLAALPKKGSLLKGTLYDGSVTALTKPVDLKIAPTGKTARFTWWCGHQQTVSNRYSVTVAIKADGTFAGTSNVGKLTVWTVKGRFLSSTSARASLRLIAICDAKGGLVTLKSAS